ncbi:unnamed protein product [Amoebophrya sp. A25]|nr:unnamed protein product [Amoebophrya sp. A25]|eukprot:GSA25T00012520001.1
MTKAVKRSLKTYHTRRKFRQRDPKIRNTPQDLLRRIFRIAKLMRNDNAAGRREWNGRRSRGGRLTFAQEQHERRIHVWQDRKEKKIYQSAHFLSCTYLCCFSTCCFELDMPCFVTMIVGLIQI